MPAGTHLAADFDQEIGEAGSVQVVSYFIDAKTFCNSGKVAVHVGELFSERRRLQAHVDFIRAGQFPARTNGLISRDLRAYCARR